MKTIGIDCRFGSSFGGLGTYTRSIVKALLARNDPWNYVLFVTSDSEPWVAEFVLSERVSVVTAPYKHYSFAEQWHFPILLRESGCDVFFAPHFNVPYLCTTRFICVVHDMILDTFPNSAGFLKRLAYRMLLRRSVTRARQVVSVSEATKSDVVKKYPSTQSKLTVIYPGIDTNIRRPDEGQIARVRSDYQLPSRFLLYVGNNKEHKNVPLLLRSFIAARLPDMHLVLVAGGKECEGMRLAANVLRLPSVESSHLPALFCAAEGFVTATLAEGFGLPMVEALALGTPVLATNIPALREVLGSHALLVDPTENALANGMKQLVTDPLLRSPERLQLALEWSRRYSWDTSAGSLAELIAKELS